MNETKLTDTERLDKLERIENLVRLRHWFGVTASGYVTSGPRNSKAAPYRTLREAIDAAPAPKGRAVEKVEKGELA